MKHIAVFNLIIVLLLIKNVKVAFIILHLVDRGLVEYSLEGFVLRLECFEVDDL